MKKILAIVLALMLALTMTAGAVAENENPVAGKKVAYVMLLPSATIFQMWKDSCADLCKALDVDFDFFFCNGDFNAWMDTINSCAAAGYDGLLISHGNQDGSYVFLKEVAEKYPELKYKYRNREFWCRGYYVDTAGKNTKKIAQYIQNQLKEDQLTDQMTLKEYMDPLAGNK